MKIVVLMAAFLMVAANVAAQESDEDAAQIRRRRMIEVRAEIDARRAARAMQGADRAIYRAQLWRESDEGKAAARNEAFRDAAANAAAVETHTPEEWRRIKERTAKAIAEAAEKKAAEEKAKAQAVQEQKAKLDREIAELTAKRAALQREIFRSKAQARIDAGSENAPSKGK